MSDETTAFRTCPLCEAGCGLELRVEAERVTRVRGDRDDVFSHGFLCPKGSSIGHLHDDPDRLRRPLVKRDGEFVEVSWDEAFAEIEATLLPLLAEHGRDACAVYLGNPGAHSLAPLLYNRSVIRALGTRNRFSASTVDQRPKEISASLMFGSVAVPVPDLDRTSLIVLLGANPYASNGSLCTAPDFPGRLEAIRERGGSVVVVDPRRSETAEHADLHLAIRPGSDAALLAALVHELFANGWATPGHLAEHLDGWDDLAGLVASFTPERVAGFCGIEAEAITDLARRLHEAPTAAVYGRIGTCTQQFGTLASWLVDVVNACTGNLDREGGAMFSKGAVGQPSTKGAPGQGRGFRMGRAVSRVGGWPESLGEFPVSALPEEIETPGEGQVRALITIAGNPVSSNPNSGRLGAALATLECFIAVDPYLNETTRHATVILPPPSALQKSHYDIALLNFAVRNVANYSPAVLPLDDGQPTEWELLLRLAAVLSGEGLAADLDAADRSIARAMAASATKDPHGSVFERDPDELLAMVGDRRGPERLLDIMLRTGPYGDGFGTDPDGLTLGVLEANPHGVDLGPLEGGRIPDLLRTPTGLVDLAPEMLRADLARLDGAVTTPAEDELVLIGRRHVRSNNSWMHNVRVLMKGRNRCTLMIHPTDAERLGVAHGERARVASRVGAVEVVAEVTDAVRPGVVSLPHGFGQRLPGVRLSIATEYEGVNTNLLTDESFLDPISGNVALNGVPVEVAAVGV
ncbi:MAG: molybdopterin-dependent oxidoreductase [Ilumatobacteraceae bacterium]